MAWNKNWGATYLSSSRSKNKRATKSEIDADKLLPQWMTKGYMGHVMQCNIACGQCASFAACQAHINVKADTSYCQYRPSRFKGADAFLNI